MKKSFRLNLVLLLVVCALLKLCSGTPSDSEIKAAVGQHVKVETVNLKKALAVVNHP
jgi:hypothetical protein